MKTGRTALALCGAAAIILGAPRLWNDDAAIATRPYSTEQRPRIEVPAGRGAEFQKQTGPVRSISAAEKSTQPTAVERDFDRATDLFQFAFTAGDSADPRTLVHGFSAAQICIGLQLDWSRLEPLLVAGVDADPKNRMRSQSIALLRDRCKGFMLNDRAANVAVRARIRQQAQLNPTIYLGGADPPITDQQMESIIAEQDWASAINASGSMIQAIAGKQGSTRTPSEGALLVSAFHLSLCDIGADCSERSLIYAASCAYNVDNCFESLEAVYMKGYMAGVPPSDAARLETVRARLVEAWKTGDLDYFGVRPSR